MVCINGDVSLSAMLDTYPTSPGRHSCCLFRFLALDRFVYAEDKSLMKLVFPWFVLPLVGKDLMRTAHYQGFGRHSKEENWLMMEDDFKALADYMGKIGLKFHQLVPYLDISILEWQMTSHQKILAHPG